MSASISDLPACFFNSSLCPQWLRKYQRDAAVPHKDTTTKSCCAGASPKFILLFQSYLVLFFVGLLYLLWNRHILWLVSLAGIIALPVITTHLTIHLTKGKHLRAHQFPYKSPQSWLFYRTAHTLFWIFNSFSSTRLVFTRLSKSAAELNWMTFDMRGRQFRERSGDRSSDREEVERFG